MLKSNRIILVLTLVIYILAGRVIFNLRGTLRKFAGNPGGTSPRTPTAPTRDTLGRASMTRPYSTHAPGEHLHQDVLTSYSCTISSGGKEPPVLTTRSRNSAVEANTAAWAYCRCAMLFFIALVITWVNFPESIITLYK